MFAAGSIKSSKWGWDVKGYTPKYDSSYTFASTSGFWSPLTLAPNGFYYALPRTWYKSTGVVANEVLCFKPGNSNNKDNKWTSGQAYLVPGVNLPNSPKQPQLPYYWATTSGGTQFRFPSKGVLAPNGYLYFFGMSEKSYVILKPQTNVDLDPIQFTEWEVVNYNDTTPQIDNVADGANGGSFYSGGVLGRDGYIYLIPSPEGATSNFTNINKQRIIRIAPRNTSVNTGATDIIQLGYYNASSLARCFNNASASTPRPYAFGVDSSGVELSVPSDLTATAYGSNANGNKLYGSSLANAIVHPNGKIYLFGGASKRIYILDPTKWGTSSEIYTNNNIYIPNVLTSLPNRGWYSSGVNNGSGFTATLEKLKPSQDPETLKIYFGYGGMINSLMTSASTNREYTSTIVFDPATETFESNLYDEVTNEGISIIGSSQSAEANSSSSFLNLPNGHIFQSVKYDPNSTNPFGKLIYPKEDGSIKYLGPQKRSIVSSTEITVTNSYFVYNGADGNGSAIPGIKKSFGKTILSAANGACEITSVKGFYPGIKNFDYDDSTTDADIYDIPNDISNLPTSLWNAYFNKPR
jgi:hypothetical protein